MNRKIHTIVSSNSDGPLLEAHHNHKTVVGLLLESTTFEVRIDDKKNCTTKLSLSVVDATPSRSVV